MNPTTDYSTQTALVTGANSGLGFEAARQLAALGYGQVVLACRTEEKGSAAAAELRQLTGTDPFSTLAIDVAEVGSARTAAAELVNRGQRFDVVLLNAGMVPVEPAHTSEGIEVCFAASLVGHHVLTTALLDAGLITDGAAVLLVGSEAANNEITRLMGMGVYDFVLGEASDFGASPKEAMTNFALAPAAGPKFNGNRQYASTKAFSAWWSAAMARRVGPGINFYTVSPGSNMGTNAGRHIKGPMKAMFAVMRTVGKHIGMDQPVDVGAKRYIDVVHGINGSFDGGRTYTSKPNKLTGPLAACTQPHLVDVDRQDLALEVLEDLIAQVS